LHALLARRRRRTERIDSGRRGTVAEPRHVGAVSAAEQAETIGRLQRVAAKVLRRTALKALQEREQTRRRHSFAAA
jgi:hypothetical protein